MKARTSHPMRRRLHRAVRAAAVVTYVAGASVAPGCATTMPEDAQTMPSSVEFADDDTAAESARVAELEARIEELERDLARVQPTVRPSVRLEPGTTTDPEALLAGAEAFRAPESESGTDDRTEEESPSNGPRTVLRLYETRPETYDVPATSERLPVVAMPPAPLPSSAGPPMASVPAATAPRVPAAVATVTMPGVYGQPNQAMNPTASSPPGEPGPFPLFAASAPAPVAMRAAEPAADAELAEYRVGLAHLTGRRYEAAVGSLSGFLRDHPGSARASDASYWRATAHYALRRYREALVDYERVVRLAPRGERAADSLYHTALCHRRLGDDARASRAFARLQSEYPDSVAARLALREDTT